MKKNTKRILVTSGAAALGIAALGAASHAMTNFLVKVALDRDEPQNVKNMDKAKEFLTGSPDTQSFVETLNIASERLQNSGLETVEILSHDGKKLVGHWYSCKDAKRTIIAMHGWRSSWANDFGMISDFWQENGCNVLYAEQRGQGSSGGDYMGFGLLERYDCLEWIHWVNNRCDPAFPIYLGGVSMGATTVLMAAGLNLPENVCGIVADCGFTSPYAIWKHVAENNLHLVYGIREGAADDLCKKRISVGTKAYSTTEAMKECSIPVLFIHGTDDKFVPPVMTYENYLACAAPKRLLVVPGADHGMSYYIDKTGYEEEVQRLWNTYDRVISKCGEETI